MTTLQHNSNSTTRPTKEWATTTLRKCGTAAPICDRRSGPNGRFVDSRTAQNILPSSTLNPLLEYRIHSHPHPTSLAAAAIAIASIAIAFVVLAFPAVWIQVNELMLSVTARPGALPAFYQNPLLLRIPLLATYTLPAFGTLLGASGLALRCSYPCLVLLGTLSNIAGLITALIA